MAKPPAVPLQAVIARLRDLDKEDVSRVYNTLSFIAPTVFSDLNIACAIVSRACSFGREAFADIRWLNDLVVLETNLAKLFQG